MSKCLRFMISLLLCALALQAVAQTVYVPPELAPWRQWVLQGKEYRACPFIYDRAAAGADDFVCAWPGLLSLSVDGAGGSFSQSWTVEADRQWIALPGDGKQWPEAVQLDGRPASVVLREGAPMLRLAPGQHSVSGRFSWEQRPQTLSLPRQTGLLALTVDGRQIGRPVWSDSGIWLGERSQQQAEQDSVQVQVYRLLADDVPTRLTTLLSIDVSGSVREESFGPALPAGWIPLAIESDLPARLEPDGSIRLQLRPGHWQLRLQARAAEVLDQLTMPRAQGHLPDSEIWSYQANGLLRVTAAESTNPVDPLQVDVPGEWQSLPAFRLQAGDAVTLVERSRGRVATDNRLQLQRKLWLDFNGEGFVYADSIGGQMRSDWRLNMVAPYSLLSASEAGENLLITQSKEGGPAGVELRQSEVALEALGRIGTRGEFAAAGWQSRLDSMAIDLNLPPGQRLLAAPGVDSATTSWVSQWQLLDFFLVLIVTVATARLFGNSAAAIALLGLTLSIHEPNSAAWSWLNLLAAIALVRVAPAGRFAAAARAYRALSALVLLGILIPFMVFQVRDAIYPQLEQQQTAYGFDGSGAAQRGIYPASETVAFDQPEGKPSRVNLAAPVAEEIAVTASKIRRNYSRYADSAIVQAGPGRPSWTWNQYRLDFSGPVEVDRSMRLIIIPRWMLSLLRLLLVLALAAFAALLASEILGRKPRWPMLRGLRIGRSGAASAALLCACLLGASPDARAEVPSPQILQELERRLLTAPDCVPRCAEIVAARVTVSADTLSVDLTVQALEEVAIPLPGSMNGWRAEQIAVNGSASAAVYRGNAGELWIRARAGQTSVSMRGALPPVASIEVPFPAPPRRITAGGDGWLIAGIRDRQLSSGSLQLTRLQKQSSAEQGDAWQMSRLPLFVRIERQVELDLDWRVNTTVYRVAPQQGALTLEVPLLAGESVVSGEFKIRDNKLQLSMDPGAQSISWSSTLPRSSPLTLSVAKGEPWSETWRLAAGSVWHATFAGVPESDTGGQASGVWTAEFHPRGGESLTVEADRPEGVAGNTLAFDAVQLQTTSGARSQDATLTLQYRSTRGAQHIVTLPANAEVVAVSIDGSNEPLRASDGKLNLPILPGEHTIAVNWRTDSTLSFREQSPPVDLGAEAGNIRLGMALPDNRWILFTSGPELGPAVLYWSELAALILLALVLGRIQLTPLGTLQWVLLGLGFSTFSWGAFAVVAVWLLITGSRQYWKAAQAAWIFNLRQIAFALLSVAALGAIVTSLPAGLLGTPDMHIEGYTPYETALSWFADRSASALPQASVITAPLWMYKALILVWALWLSLALLKWLPWVWKAFVQDGVWQPLRSVRNASAGSKQE